MGQTVFSNGRNTFDTVIEGTTVRLQGQATIGNESTFYGQMTKMEGGDYVGDYSQGNISLADPARDAAMMTEAAQLWVQLGTDIAAKKEEVSA